MIRHLYQRYLQLGNVRALATELERAGTTTPRRTRTNGTTYGGALFSRGQLYVILKNPIYAGDIAHGKLT